MHSILVGNTGFVGSNLEATMNFDTSVNSSNVQNVFGEKPDILIYAGVRGTKFIANINPEEDWRNIEEAKKNIININPRKLVLISSVDVYDDLDGKDENYHIRSDRLNHYGKHRYMLEKWVKNNIDDYHIIRLPAIFGINLKKNFVYDLINPIPRYLTSGYFEKICKEKDVSNYYTYRNGIYEIAFQDAELYDFCSSSVYNAANFTDSRSKYQYFDLRSLYKLIQYMLERNIVLLNCVTEPVCSSDLYFEIYKTKFDNQINTNPIKYNLRSRIQFNEFVNKNGWLLEKQKVISHLVKYIEEEKEKLQRVLKL